MGFPSIQVPLMYQRHSPGSGRDLPSRRSVLSTVFCGVVQSNCSIRLHRSPLLTAGDRKFFTFFVLNSGGTVPSDQKVGVPVPLVSPVNYAYAAE